MYLKKLPPLFLLLLLMMLHGCAIVPTPILIQQPTIGTRTTTSPSWDAVFLLPPTLIYERVRTERRLSPKRYGAEETSNNTLQLAESSISQKGFRVLQEKDLTPDQKIKLGNILLDITNQSEKFLKQRTVHTTLKVSAQELYTTVGTEAVVVHVFKVKVGVGGYWDPTSGRTPPGTSTSDIKAVLIDVRTGEIVWQREVFFRSMPETSILNEALTMMYATFPEKTGR